MKSLIFSFLLFTSTMAVSQTADGIVAKHLESIGGIDNWNKINTSYTEITTDMGGVKVPIKMWQSHMKGMRVEFEIQGMTGIQVITDKDGWSLMPFMGKADPEPTNEEQLKMAQSQLDLRGQLVDYASKGSTIEYLGEDEVEGVEVFKIRLTDKNKTETNYFMDKENYYIVKSTTKTTFQGQEVENTTVYSNYKKVDNVFFPFSMNGQMGQVDIQKLELNPKIDEAIYKMPTK